MTTHDLDRIEMALRIAEDALTSFTPGRISSTLKTGGDPVTDADTAVDDAVKTALLENGEGWLSEETADGEDRLRRSRVWIVDPIDGTREFIQGIPEWCVSIGLAVNGVPVAGGILNPATGERILGSEQTGIIYDGHRPRVGAGVIHEAEILTSRSEVKRDEWTWATARGLNITPMGSVAYKLALVAAGRADATWTLVPKHEWDVAAGAALLSSAGLHQRRTDGAPLIFNARDTLLPGFIASSASLAEQVEALLSTRLTS